MVTKKCARCKENKPLDGFSKGQNLDGLQSYCRKCNTQVNIESQLRNGNKFWHRDGYPSEKAHFNAALEQYAEVFNMPQLLKYKKQ